MPDPENKPFSLRDHPKTAAATVLFLTALNMNALEGRLEDGVPPPGVPPKDGTQGPGESAPEKTQINIGGRGVGKVALSYDKLGRPEPGKVKINSQTGVISRIR